mgnify:CR=1 FL=1
MTPLGAKLRAMREERGVTLDGLFMLFGVRSRGEGHGLRRQRWRQPQHGQQAAQQGGTHGRTTDG